MKILYRFCTFEWWASAAVPLWIVGYTIMRINWTSIRKALERDDGWAIFLLIGTLVIPPAAGFIGPYALITAALVGIAEVIVHVYKKRKKYLDDVMNHL